jgi:hypothetical protein
VAGLISGEMLRILLVSSNEAVRNEIGVALVGRARAPRGYLVSPPAIAAGRAPDIFEPGRTIDGETSGEKC